MVRLDFYVQHLVRHNAAAIEIASGNPVTFRFPEGDRQSNKPIDHAQVVQLVQEAAPPDAMAALRQSGATSFRHEGGGAVVEVTVRAFAGAWQVTLTPAPAAAAAAGRRMEVEPVPLPPAEELPLERPMGGAAAQPIQQRPPSVSPPRVETADDEPRIHRLLREMIAVGASDLHLSSEVPPMVRHDGEMQRLGERPPIDPDDLRDMLGEILPERNREELDATSDTDFAHEILGLARFRANLFVDRKGIGAVFRQIPFELLDVKKLGLPDKVLELCWLSKGLVVVTGPTGSGKSTTLASLIDFINDHRNDHIITIEDPIEFVHQNKKCLVNQREVGMHTQSFKRALRAALREDPDIVLVGEMRDLETIAIAIETAETGHLVFGTLHTSSAASTVDRIIDQFPPDQQEQIRVMLSESLRGVIAQVLCKKKGGGRVAAYEVLVTNPAVSNLIREGKTYQLTSVMQTGKNLGMQTMNDHLLALVKQGVVEPREAYVKSNDKNGMRDLMQRSGIPLPT